MLTPFYDYFAYGLHIASDIALSELMPLPVASEADLVIRLDEAAQGSEANETELTCIGREEAILNSPGVAHFTIRKGRDIAIAPARGVDADILRAFLLGPVLAITLFQRGFLVLHASSVALRESGRTWGVVSFLGHSGHGKSTLAAALHARGHQLMGDDVIAVPIELAPDDVTAVPLVYPAYPQLRLWPQSVRAIGQNPDEMSLLHPGQQRRVQRVPEGFSHQPSPLRRLYFLAVGDALGIEVMSPGQMLMQTVQRAYLTNWLEGEDAARQLQQCRSLLLQIGAFRLQRPPDLSLLSQTAAMVEEHARQAL